LKDFLAALQKLERGADNHPPKGLYARRKKGKPESTVHLKLALGFLRLSYDEEGVLSLIAFVLERDERAREIGPRLELNGDTVTFIEENGVSGLQWKDGAVIWGHTFEDSLPSPVRDDAPPMSLGEWIDDRARVMTNPDQETLAPIVEAERARQALPSIAQLLRDYPSSGALHDLLDKQPENRAEIDFLADAVQRGLEEKDAHLVIMAAHPLANTPVDAEYALLRLTDCMEWAIANGRMNSAESISFDLEENLRRVDALTLKRLRALAPKLDNDSLALSLKRLK
jgi:hypothetical protein